MDPQPASSPTGFYEWNPNEDDVLICRAVREETPDVKTFVFAPRKGRHFTYQPGQFLTFEFEISGETIYRCYTISSTPTRPDTVSITVKRVAGGPVSNWLHDQFRPGMMLRATGPMGDFSWTVKPTQPKYLLISGGSGITPMMSMTRSAFDLAEIRDTLFVHAARSPADLIFRDELDFMARRNRSIRVGYICEGDSPHEAWSGLRGRLTHGALTALAPDFMDRVVFVCGPAPFMAAVHAVLAAAGFDMSRYFQESFRFEDLSPAEQEAVEEAADELSTDITTYRIEFAKTRRVVDCPENITILDAARRAGIRLPSSCTKGLCGTCKSRKVSGDVEMSHQGGIRQREVDQGMILICCSRPRSDVVIDR
ncbi:hybrid-cluster NAD(P)-dependent oxidoreductase [Aureimonas fodinaquatilis]|uniref:Hybrid-cluster NAD(P)-dependent oxidoreductase n=1 Tax=Aureimonas fodinaquatilis TaxID=2565783 RepID=A0A5B0E137_9HYPH|nr:hybrid-cluster NAD(P)-dependent oxidoreductase [Aureimonas fodinaquatilis]KAA0972543.1 hybrid-cluster NAD(P)-dependent oxidoreductase [Aureimonas fodinaquatilis]